MNPQAMIYDPLYEPISGQNAVANQHKPNFGLGGSSSHYDDSFGPCSKCLDLIVGTSTGCSAMGRLYHIKCFTCHKCGCKLQGKPYYALDGKVCSGLLKCLLTHNAMVQFFSGYASTKSVILESHLSPFYTKFQFFSAFL